MSKLEAIPFLGDYIDGRFVKAERADGSFKNISPADLSDEIMHLDYKYEHIDQACEAARRAFKTWSLTPLDERIAKMKRLREVYAAHEAEIASTIARETGKPLWESATEAKAMINKIDITLEHSMKLVAEERITNALPGNVDGVIRHRARGVMAVLGPFNFPGHLPNGHIVPAVATGNTIVFKPSEQTPAIAQLMAQMFEKAEFPKGVFNLVQGEGETGRKLTMNDNVDGILFTGAYETGLKIKQATLDHHWKILALEMGGKNASIVWDDADINKALYESLIGSFITAGQRCSCTSRIILHKKIADRFINTFYENAKKLTIGHWQDNPFMGPLINAAAVEKYLRFQEIAQREGAERLMRGKVLEPSAVGGRKGTYVTPSICIIPAFDRKSVYQKSEIFGPNVAVYTVDTIDEALEINDSTGFGLAASVFTKQKDIYDYVAARARVGIVNWNRTTNGASSRLPFGGIGKSGNDRPTAHYAVQYCTIPVASLEDSSGFDPKASLPGFTFEQVKE